MGVSGSSGTKPRFSGRGSFANQLVMVACHDERADALGATYKGVTWKGTEDHKRWPYDPPLSDTGIKNVQDTVKQLQFFLEQNEVKMNIIITSPSLRCVQTAAYFAFCLSSSGPRPHLIVDQQLGDTYGPSLLGRTEPTSSVTRPMEETRRICKGLMIKVQARVSGKPPIWPETMRDARKRIASRFLVHMDRSSRSKWNVILVTHAEGVGASLKLMPPQADSVAEQVGRGGYFLAKRMQEIGFGMASDDEIKAKTGFFDAFMPTGEGDSTMVIPPAAAGGLTTSPGGVADDEELDLGPMTRQESPESNYSAASAESKSSMFSYQTCTTEAPDFYELPSASDGWQVKTIRIKTKKLPSEVRKQLKQLSSGANKVESMGAHSADHQAKVDAEIDRMVAYLPDKPLGYDYS